VPTTGEVVERETEMPAMAPREIAEPAALDRCYIQRMRLILIIVFLSALLCNHLFGECTSLTIKCLSRSTLVQRPSTIYRCCA